MRLNPFSRPKGSSGRPSRGGYLDSEDEDIAVARLKNSSNSKRSNSKNGRKRSSTPGRNGRGRDAPPAQSPAGGLSFAGGSSFAREQMTPRGRSRSVSRSRRSSGSRSNSNHKRNSNSNLSEPEDSDCDDPSSPERGPVSRRRTSSASKQQQRRVVRELSSSPERDPVARRRNGNGAASKASRRSATRAAESRTYSLSSSEEEEESDDEQQQQRRRTTTTVSNKQQRSRGRSPVTGSSERDRSVSRSRSRNSRVVTRHTRDNSRSRDASPSSVEDNGIVRPQSNRSRSANRTPAKHIRSKSLKKQAWGLSKKMMPTSPFVRRNNHKKQKDKRQDHHDDPEVFSDDNSDTMEEYYEQRDAPEEPRAHRQQQHKKQPVVMDEHYVAKKRETFANLYEYDNFPAIDRVPTAIGYHSDDSEQECDGVCHNTNASSSRHHRSVGGGAAAADHDGDNVDGDYDDDNKSFTSRYSIDVKSVRRSKLKKKKDGSRRTNYFSGRGENGQDEDEFSHDENDDKYAQYLAGVDMNAVMSDSSESCTPTWHPVLDAEDSDWYDDDHEDVDEDEAAIMKLSKRGGKNKKYQVSGKDKKERTAATKKSKKGAKAAAAAAAAAKKNAGGKGGEETAVSADQKEEQEDDVPNADAIVANRSDMSDLLPKSSRARVPRGPLDDEDDIAFDDDDMTGAVTKHHQRLKQPDGRKKGRKSKFDEEEDDDDDDSDLSDDSIDETMQRDGRKGRSGKARKGVVMNGNTGVGIRHNTKAAKAKSKPKSFAHKLKGFAGRGGRRNTTPDYASSSDESSEASVGLAATQTFYSEDPSNRGRVDPSLMQLEEEEFKESTATHNMLRQNRKEITELDELDEASIRPDMNQAACSMFNFGLPSFFGASTQPKTDDEPLDGIQIQRMKDAKHDLENKPKVEVILQDLQDPLAEKYDQLQNMQRKQKKELQREKEAQQEIEKREREELLQMKRDMRVLEQKKMRMAQNKDSRALQTMDEAPNLNRGKSQSFVMDISDWVLQLDNPGTPGKKSAKDTPRTNGRDGNSSPVEKLPFNTIEVPTAATMDSEDNGRKHSRKARTSKKGGNSNHHKHVGGQKKNDKKKKKGWFRRGV